MGNEMGNNNTSGLREEGNTEPENQKKSLHESTYARDVNGENNEDPTAESKDYHQKESVLTSNDLKGAGDSPGHNQTPDETEQQVPEVHSEESPKAEKNIDKGGVEDCVVQSADSLAEELEGNGKGSSLNSEEKVLEMNNNQIEDFFKTGKEDNATSVAISSGNIPEFEDSAELKSDQHELAEVHAGQSEQNGINSLKGSEYMPGSLVASNSKEDGLLLDTCVSDNTEGADVSGADSDVIERGEELLWKEMLSEDDEMSSKEKSDVEAGIEDGSELSKTTKVLSDLSDVNSGEIAAQINCKGNSIGSESQLQEVCSPEDKYKFLTQETELMGKELESADRKHDDNEPVRLSEIDKANASQIGSFTMPDRENIEKGGFVTIVHPTAGNGNCQVEEVKVFEESDSHNEASEECCKGPEGKVKMVHELGTLAAKSAIANGKINGGELGDAKPEACMAHDGCNGNCLVDEAKAMEKSDDQNEASESEAHLEGSQVKIMVVPELGNTDERSIANGENYEETAFSKRKADTAHDAVSNGNCKAEEAKCIEVFDNHSEASEGRFMILPEHGMLPSVLHATNGKQSEKESENFRVKKEEPTEKNVGETKENINADDAKYGEEFVSQQLPTQENPSLPCDPASFFQSEHSQQKNVMVSEDAQDSNELTFELKLESRSAAETLVSKIELATEKPAAEGLPFVTEAATEIVTKTNSSASACNSSEQHQKNETTIFAKDGIQEKENERSLSTDPIPEKQVQGQQQKSQNFATEKTVSAVQLENEKPQQKVSDYNSVVLMTVTKDNSSPSATQRSKQCDRVGTCVLAKGCYERQASVGRFSNGSFSDYLNVHTEMRKSPSFDLDLRIEASTEESEKTPLIYQDKNAIESLSSQADISLQKSFPQAQYSKEAPRYQEMPLEEKVIPLERSDSDKSKTPFLGYLKEDEEAKPQKQDKQAGAEKEINKENSPMPSKIKEKHKRRSNLFSNCLCCTTTTVIN